MFWIRFHSCGVVTLCLIKYVLDQIRIVVLRFPSNEELGNEFVWVASRSLQAGKQWISDPRFGHNILTNKKDRILANGSNLIGVFQPTTRNPLFSFF
jgi:hypothetical protein